MEKQHLVNSQITLEKVLLLDENSEKIGEMSLREALYRANEQGLDLMQLGEKKDATNRHPVAICKIINYESWLYHETKNERKQKFKNRSQEMKSIQFRPATDDNDFNLKIKKIIEFLESNHKVKVVLKLKSREGAMRAVNDAFIQRIIEQISEKGVLDSRISSTFKEINFIVKPEKKPVTKVKNGSTENEVKKDVDESEPINKRQNSI